MKEIYKRYIENSVDEDLKSKMVFVGGPRQVGKTTFALTFLSEPSEKHPAYLNWDNILIRSALLRGELPSNESIIVLDEIHKFARWRNLVKGFYDARKSEISFIITGSARLDYYSKGGDSLQGRYHYYRLHPFSLREINTDPSQSDVQRLLKYGGFPEPFLMAEEKFWRRWQRERLQRVIYEDIRDLENIKEISLLELLAEELPNRVGAPLSVKKLKELLQVAHETVERWLKIFERMYYCYRIPPYGSPKVRAVKKEQKLYLWDWSIVPDSGPRFENFIASHLLKAIHYWIDAGFADYGLYFLRDKLKREVDFLITRNNIPWILVEVKSAESKIISPPLQYFQKLLKVEHAFQVSADAPFIEKDCFTAKRAVKVPAQTLLSQLV